MIYIKPILNTNKLNLEQFEERKKRNISKGKQIILHQFLNSLYYKFYYIDY